MSFVELNFDSKLEKECFATIDLFFKEIVCDDISRQSTLLRMMLPITIVLTEN